MGNWTIFGNLAISDTGETIQKISDTMSISSSGVIYQQLGNMMVDLEFLPTTSTQPRMASSCSTHLETIIFGLS